MRRGAPIRVPPRLGTIFLSVSCDCRKWQSCPGRADYRHALPLLSFSRLRYFTFLRTQTNMLRDLKDGLREAVVLRLARPSCAVLLAARASHPNAGGSGDVRRDPVQIRVAKDAVRLREGARRDPLRVAVRGRGVRGVRRRREMGGLPRLPVRPRGVRGRRGGARGAGSIRKGWTDWHSRPFGRGYPWRNCRRSAAGDSPGDEKAFASRVDAISWPGRASGRDGVRVASLDALVHWAPVRRRIETVRRRSAAEFHALPVETRSGPAHLAPRCEKRWSAMPDLKPCPPGHPNPDRAGARFRESEDVEALFPGHAGVYLPAREPGGALGAESGFPIQSIHIGTGSDMAQMNGGAAVVETLRARGSDTRVRPSRIFNDGGLRRPLRRPRHQVRGRPARSLRRSHGGRVRACHGPSRRLLSGPSRPRVRQHGGRHGRGQARLLARRLSHRTGRHRSLWPGCVPGGSINRISSRPWSRRTSR